MANFWNAPGLMVTHTEATVGWLFKETCKNISKWNWNLNCIYVSTFKSEWRWLWRIMWWLVSQEYCWIDWSVLKFQRQCWFARILKILHNLSRIFSDNRLFLTPPRLISCCNYPSREMLSSEGGVSYVLHKNQHIFTINWQYKYKSPLSWKEKEIIAVWQLRK